MWKIYIDIFRAIYAHKYLKYFIYTCVYLRLHSGEIEIDSFRLPDYTPGFLANI